MTVYLFVSGSTQYVSHTMPIFLNDTKYDTIYSTTYSII